MVRLSKDQTAGAKRARRNPAASHPGYAEARTGLRGLTERQWFIGTLVVSGLLLLITFRGCILPTGVGPKVKPNQAVTTTPAPGAETPAPQPAGSEYTVVAGDNPSKIAGKLNVDLDALLQANGLNRQSRLTIGQKMKVPQ